MWHQPSQWWRTLFFLVFWAWICMFFCLLIEQIIFPLATTIGRGIIDRSRKTTERWKKNKKINKKPKKKIKDCNLRWFSKNLSMLCFFIHFLFGSTYRSFLSMWFSQIPIHVPIINHSQTKKELHFILLAFDLTEKEKRCSEIQFYALISPFGFWGISTWTG